MLCPPLSYLNMSYICWNEPCWRQASMILKGGCVIYSVQNPGYDLSKAGDIYVEGYRGIETEWRPRLSPDVLVPFWIPTLLFAALSMTLHLQPAHRRGKREKLGMCVKCGYDLRASKDRCPECGGGFVS